MDAATRELLSQVLSLFLQALLMFLLGAGMWLVKAVRDRFAIEATEKQQAILKRVAEQGIYFAEEWSARQRGALSGEEKRQLALGYAKKVLPAMVKAKDDVVTMDRYLHAALGAKKGFGASKDIGEDMRN